MATNSREFVMKGLSAVQDNAFFLHTVQELLFHRERVDKSFFNPATLKKTPRPGPNYNRYCDNAVLFLGNTMQEFQLLRFINDWDLQILKQVLQLGKTLSGLSNEVVKALRASKPKKSKPMSTQQRSISEDDKLREVEKKTSDLQQEWAESEWAIKETLAPQVRSEVDRASAITGEEPIPATTIRELVLRNQIHKSSKGFIDSMRANSTDPIKQLESGAQRISAIVENWPDIPWDQPSWAAATLAVIYDSDTSILYTGASQARCDGVFVVEKLTKEICRRRLGRPFLKIVDEQNEIFWKRPSSSSPTTAEIVQVRGSKSSPILCWAIQGRSAKNFKPPCPRCQEHYPSWYKHGGNEVSAKKKNRNCSNACCAESVAAAKIYSLRHLLPRIP